MLNVTFLLGRIGKYPPSFRTLPRGCVCTFSVATNDEYWDRSVGEPKNKVEWHKVCCYGKDENSGRMKYLRAILPGDLITVVGKACHRSYTNNAGQQVKDHYIDISALHSKIKIIQHARHREKPGEHVDGDPIDAIDIITTNGDENEPEYPFGDGTDGGEVF